MGFDLCVLVNFHIQRSLAHVSRLIEEERWIPPDTSFAISCWLQHFLMDASLIRRSISHPNADCLHSNYKSRSWTQSSSTTISDNLTRLHSFSWSLPASLLSHASEQKHAHRHRLHCGAPGLLHPKHFLLTSMLIPLKLLPQLNAISHRTFFSCTECCNPTIKYSFAPIFRGMTNRTDRSLS